MAKKLSDVLAGTNKSRTRPGSTGTRPGLDYASKMKDERDFVASHEVQEFDDRVGNGSDVYNATNIKHNPDDRHGHIPKPEDEKQYKQANEEAVTSSPRPKPRPGRDLPGGGYQWPNGAIEPGPGFNPLSSDPEPEVNSSIRPKPRPAGIISSPRPKPRPVVAEAKKEYEEDETDEKEMMKNQLSFIKLASDKIMAHVNSTKDPEEWFQNKLSGLHANMKDLHAYVAGDKGEVKEEVELEESNEHRTRDELKSQGKYKEAGEHAYKHGLGRSYGPHFGMRSSKNSAETEFHKGYDQAQARARLKEEAEGDPRVEPKDVNSKGKPLKLITGQVKESNHDGSRTKTGTEQARARFDKKMERKEMQKEREENDN